MDKRRKEGSYLIRNVFFVVMIFMVSISLIKFQNISMKSVKSISSFQRINNLIEIIKNELFFNKQYLKLENYAYLYEEDINNQQYVELSDIFVDTNDSNENYFYLVSNFPANSIDIQYFQKGKLILEQTLII